MVLGAVAMLALVAPASASAVASGEPNENPLSATGPILANDGTATGVIETQNDQDWFVFHITGITQFVLTLENRTINQDKCWYLDAAVSNSNNREVLSVSNNKPGTSQTRTLTIPSAGTFYLKVSNNSGCDPSGMTASTYRLVLSPPSALAAQPFTPPPPSPVSTAPAPVAPAPAPAPAPIPAPVSTPQPPACALIDRAAKRGTAFRVRCYRLPGTTLRVRYKRKNTLVTKVVPVKDGIARAGTRGLAYGSWAVSFLSDSGKIGSGRVAVRRR